VKFQITICVPFPTNLVNVITLTGQIHFLCNDPFELFHKMDPVSFDRQIKNKIPIAGLIWQQEL